MIGAFSYNKWRSFRDGQHFAAKYYVLCELVIVGLPAAWQVKKTKIKAITAFNVIQGHRGRYQSKARMRFPISD